MIILALLGLYPLPPRMKPITLLRDLLKLSRMKRIVIYLPLSEIMGENSRMRDLKNFVTNLESSTTFQTKDSTIEWSSREEESVFGGTSKDTLE